MRKFLKILIGIVVVIALAIGSIFYFTANLVDNADAFFTAVKTGDMAKARSYLSEEFKANTDEAKLQEFLSSNAFLNFKSVSWGARTIETGGRGKLDGTITTETGGSAPVKVEFVKENGGWKIYSIRKPESGIVDQPQGLQLPAESAQVQLVVDAIRVFGKSVNDKSMAKFYDYIAQVWQRETTVEDLDRNFVSFYEWGGDLSVLDNYSPVFNQPASINDDGLLVIEGYYPTKPKQVVFNQKFIYEGLGWKMIGLKLNIE